MLLSTNTDKVMSGVDKLIDAIEEFFPSIIKFGIDIIVAVLLFFVGKIVIKMILKFINRCMTKGEVDLGVKKFLESLIRFALYGVLLVIICAQVGIETTSIIAVIGSAGLALGLALQGSLSNFAGGVLILILQPFTIGDYIIDGSSGKEGMVDRIDLFYTHLHTGDNKKIIIPNGNLANAHIVNYSSNEKRRVDFAVGISYSADIDNAKNILKETAMAESKILKDEEVFVFIKELAASQVTVGIRVWAKNDDYWTVYFNLNEAFKKALDKEGIEIPYNQLSVHIEK